MSISLKNRSLISISDYTPEEICHVLDIAEDFERTPHQNLLNGGIIASLFFEPSTRTRLSFETAIQLLGGNVIGFSSTAGTSIQKGESPRQFFDETVLLYVAFSSAHQLFRRLDDKFLRCR